MIHSVYVDLYTIDQFIQSLSYSFKLIIFPNFKYHSYIRTLYKNNYKKNNYKIIYGKNLLPIFYRYKDKIKDLIIYDGQSQRTEYIYLFRFLNQWIQQNKSLNVYICNNVKNIDYLNEYFSNVKQISMIEKKDSIKIHYQANQSLFYIKNIIHQEGELLKYVIYTHSKEMCYNIKDYLQSEFPNIFVLHTKMSTHICLNTLQYISNPMNSYILVTTNMIDYGIHIPFVDVMIDTCLYTKINNGDLMISYNDKLTLEYRLYKYLTVKSVYRLISEDAYNLCVNYNKKFTHNESLLLQISHFAPIEMFMNSEELKKNKLIQYILNKKDINELTLKSKFLPKQNILLSKLIKSYLENEIETETKNETNSLKISIFILKLIALIIVDLFQSGEYKYIKYNVGGKYKINKKILSHFYELDELNLIISLFLAFKYNMDSSVIVNEFSLNESFFQKITDRVNESCRTFFPKYINWEISLEQSMNQYFYWFKKYHKIYHIPFLYKVPLSEFLIKNPFYSVSINDGHFYYTSKIDSVDFYTIVQLDRKIYPFINLSQLTTSNSVCNLFILSYYTYINWISSLKRHILNFKNEQKIRKKWKNVLDHSLFIIETMVSYRPYNYKMIQSIKEWENCINKHNESICVK